MNRYKFKVTLTNGEVNTTYEIYTRGKKEAIILAQAEAIQEGKGYELVSVEENVEDNY